MTDSTSPVTRPLTANDERLWAALAHFGNVLGFLPSLLILLIAGPRSRRVRTEAREALNFSITAAMVWIGLYLIGAVLNRLFHASPTGLDISFLLLGLVVGLAQFGVWVAVVVLSIVAGVRVSSGGTYRYPVAIRLVH